MSWQNVLVGEAFEFVRNGKNVKQTKERDGLPITRIETIAERHIDPDRVGYAGLSESGNEQWLLQSGDILFSHINSVDHIGKCAIYEGVPEKLVHGMNLIALRPSKRLFPKFAFYALSHSSFRAKFLPFVNKAVNQASISTTNLKSLQIPLPSLDEQKRIAAILDKADALRAKRRQAIALLDSLNQSIFLEMFGDPVSNPKSYPNLSVGQALADGHILEIQDGNHGERHPKVADFSDEGIPFVTANCFRKGTLNLQNAYRLSPVWVSKLRVGFAKSGDVLLTHKGTIGEAAVLSKNTPHAILSPQVTYYRPGPSLNSKFLKGVFTSPSFQAILSNASEQSTRAYIGITKQLRLPIIIPDVEGQTKYAERTSSVEALARDLSRIHTQQDALFASLQHRAFTGQL
ncbi:restriction endonuclease subunit S [Agrobacterium vaccinii]|uniref:restriction endonuclease subunit S n=1 Tax=Agrobacterium vaccinii TaxID=2735528 RepID=UPI001E5A6DEF|nr:restriction endonuclease subunit S [Agrobacterium vaccinii]UHS63475.1 restriction endonuclease subunit S [Agrobacterium vaccinii]